MKYNNNRRALYSWRNVEQHCEDNSVPKNVAQAMFDRYFELIRMGVHPRKALWIMDIIRDERE